VTLDLTPRGCGKQEAVLGLRDAKSGNLGSKIVRQFAGLHFLVSPSRAQR